MGGEPGAPCSLLPTRQPSAGDCLLSLLYSHLPSLESPGSPTLNPTHDFVQPPPIQSSSTI